MEYLAIGTFNTQGCKNEKKRYSIALDAENYRLDILALAETHVEEQYIEEIRTEKKTYKVYHNGIEGDNKFSGVGMLIDSQVDASFKRITDRICSAEVNLSKSKKLVVIVAYAPKLIQILEMNSTVH